MGAEEQEGSIGLERHATDRGASVDFFVNLAVAFEAVKAATGDIAPVKVVVVGVPDGAFCVVAAGIGDDNRGGDHGGWGVRAFLYIRTGYGRGNGNGGFFN